MQISLDTLGEKISAFHDSAVQVLQNISPAKVKGLVVLGMTGLVLAGSFGMAAPSYASNCNPNYNNNQRGAVLKSAIINSIGNVLIGRLPNNTAGSIGQSVIINEILIRNQDVYNRSGTQQAQTSMTESEWINADNQALSWQHQSQNQKFQQIQQYYQNQLANKYTTLYKKYPNSYVQLQQQQQVEQQNLDTQFSINGQRLQQEQNSQSNQLRIAHDNCQFGGTAFQNYIQIQPAQNWVNQVHAQIYGQPGNNNGLQINQNYAPTQYNAKQPRYAMR